MHQGFGAPPRPSTTGVVSKSRFLLVALRSNSPRHHNDLGILHLELEPNIPVRSIVVASKSPCRSRMALK